MQLDIHIYEPGEYSIVLYNKTTIKQFQPLNKESLIAILDKLMSKKSSDSEVSFAITTEGCMSPPKYQNTTVSQFKTLWPEQLDQQEKAMEKLSQQPSSQALNWAGKITSNQAAPAPVL
jgi:hypothetical protein